MLTSLEKDGFKLTGEVLVEIHDAKTGRLKYSHLYKNLVVDGAKASIADALRGNVDNNTGQITYCAVGTDNTAPAGADVALGAEIARKLISIRTAAGNIATFKTFFNQSEANGVLKEAGLFGDLATVTPDSGRLFCHTLINRTKTSADTLTLSWSVAVG